MSHSISRLILTGPVGVWKTLVSNVISEILIGRNIANAVIDMDCLRWAYPRPKKDPYYATLGYQNLSAIWPNHKNYSGYSGRSRLKSKKRGIIIFYRAWNYVNLDDLLRPFDKISPLYIL